MSAASAQADKPANESVEQTAAVSPELEHVRCMNCSYSLKGLTIPAHCPECGVSVRASLDFSSVFPANRFDDIVTGLRCHVMAAVLCVFLATVVVAIQRLQVIVVFALFILIVFSVGTCKLAGLWSHRRTRTQSILYVLIVTSTISFPLVPLLWLVSENWTLTAFPLTLASSGLAVQLYLILVAHLQIALLLRPESKSEPPGLFPMATGAINFMILIPGMAVAILILLGGGWVAPLAVLVLGVVSAIWCVWVVWLGICSEILRVRVERHRRNAVKRALSAESMKAI